MPQECPVSLAQLIERCWAADPLIRPNFVTILDELEGVLVDVAVDADPSANEFWRTHHKGRIEVSWDDFSNSFLKHLGIKIPGQLNGEMENEKLSEKPKSEEIQSASKESLQEFSERSPANYQIVYQEFVRRANDSNLNEIQHEGIEAMDEDDEFEEREAERLHLLNLKCLNAVMAFNSGQLETSAVNLETFGLMLNYFGPLHDPLNPSDDFLERLRNIVSKSWFHGDLQTKEAERLLEGRPNGTFMIRYSNKVLGNFTVSKIQEGKVTHQRVAHKSGSGFVLGQQSHSSLEEVIEKCSSELKLVTSCPGSKYSSLFVLSDQTSGYIGVGSGQ